MSQFLSSAVLVLVQFQDWLCLLSKGFWTAHYRFTILVEIIERVLSVSENCLDVLRRESKNETKSLYRSDTDSINIDFLTFGNNRQFEVITDKKLNDNSIQITSRLQRTYFSEIPVQTCSSSSIKQMIGTQDIFVLCSDNNTLMRFNMDYTNIMYQMARQRNITSDGDIFCKKIHINPVHLTIDIFCENKTNNNILLFIYNQDLSLWNDDEGEESAEEKEKLNSPIVLYKDEDISVNIDNINVKYVKIYLWVHMIIYNKYVVLESYKILTYRIENKTLFFVNKYMVSDRTIDVIVSSNDNNELIINNLFIVNNDDIKIMICNDQNNFIFSCRFTRDYSTLRCDSNYYTIYEAGCDTYVNMMGRTYNGLLTVSSFNKKTFRMGFIVEEKQEFVWDEDTDTTIAVRLKNINQIHYEMDVIYVIGNDIQSTAQKDSQMSNIVIMYDTLAGGYTIYRCDSHNTPSYIEVIKKISKADRNILICMHGQRMTSYEVSYSSIILNASLVQKDITEFEVRLKCTTHNDEDVDKLVTDWFNFKYHIIDDINSEFNISLHQIEVFRKNSMIRLPLNNRQITGNAPSVSLIDTKDVLLNVNGISKKDLFWISTQKIVKIVKIKGLGENLISVRNSSHLMFFYCELEFKSSLVGCYDSDFPMINLENSELLDTFLYSNKVIIAIRFCSPASDCHLRLLKIKSEDPDEVDMKEYKDFKPSAAKFMATRDVVLMQVVGKKKNEKDFGVFYAQMYASQHSYWDELTGYITLSGIRCPKSIVPADRIPNTDFFITSKCDESEVLIVLGVWFNIYDIKSSYLVSKFYIDGSGDDFMICASREKLHIVDKSNGKISSFLIDSPDAVFSLPMKEYNMTKIVDCMCDNRRKLIQVILSDDNGKSKLLINYRSDETEIFSRRVHSIVALKEWAEHLSKIINYKDDFIITLVMDSSGELRETIKVQTFALDMILDISKVNTSSNNISVDFLFELPGKYPFCFSKNLTMNLVDFNTDFHLSLREGRQKTKVINDLMINLDMLMNFEGVYLDAFSPPNNNYEVIDRYPIIKNFTKAELGEKGFYDSCSQLNYIFAFQVNENTEDKAFLYSSIDSRKLFEVKISDISSIGCVTKSNIDETGKKSIDAYFFLLAKNEKGMNIIGCLYRKLVKSSPANKSEGQEVWNFVNTSLSIDGYDRAEFINGPQDSFIVAAFSSKYGFNLIVRALWIDNLLYSSEDFSRVNKEIISNIDIVASERNIVVIYSEVNDIELRVLSLYVNKNRTLAFRSIDIFPITNLIKTAATNNYFDCQVLKRGLSGYIQLECVILDHNVYSYIVTLGLNVTTTTGSSLIVDALVIQKMMNVPNVIPKFVKIIDNLILVEATNNFSSQYLLSNVIIYHHDNKLYFNKNEQEVIYPHKIINSSILSYSTIMNRSTDISTYVYLHTSRTYRIHINIVDSPFPIILLDTSPLTLHIKNMNNIPNDSLIHFVLLNNSRYNYTLDNIIDMDSLKPNRSLIDEKKLILLILCFGGMFIISLLIIVLYCMDEKKERLDIIDVIENDDYSILQKDDK